MQKEPQAPSLPQYLSVQAVADRLGFARVTVRRYIRQGRLPAVVIGNVLRVSVEDVRAMLAEAPKPVPLAERKRGSNLPNLRREAA